MGDLGISRGVIGLRMFSAHGGVYIVGFWFESVSCECGRVSHLGMELV